MPEERATRIHRLFAAADTLLEILSSNEDLDDMIGRLVEDPRCAGALSHGASTHAEFLEAFAMLTRMGFFEEPTPTTTDPD